MYRFTAEDPYAPLPDHLPRFSINFALTPKDNNNILICFAVFLHDLCRKLRELSDEIITVDLDNIGYRLGDGLIVGYLQFKTNSIRGIYEWVQAHASVWINPSHGVVYYDTNAGVVTGELLHVWKSVVDIAVR